MVEIVGVALSSAELAFVFTFLLFAGIVKGCTGFAVGLLAVPVLIQVFPPKIALAALTLPMLLANVPILWTDGVPWSFFHERLGFLVVSVAGTIAGVVGLAVISPELISLLVTAYVLAFLALQRLGTRGGVWATKERSGLVVGGIGSVISGAFLTGGPIFVSYLYALKTKKTEFATILATIFLVITSIRTLALLPVGLFGYREIVLGVGFLVPLTLGILVGTRIRPYISQSTFNSFVEVLLVAIALKLAYDSRTFFL